MYRGMKSIKPYNSKALFPAHLSECTCWCQSRVYYTDNIVSLFRQWETGRVRNIRIEFQEGSRYILMWNGSLPTGLARPPKGRPLTLVK